VWWDSKSQILTVLCCPSFHETALSLSPPPPPRDLDTNCLHVFLFNPHSANTN
jgi:hypothetical protein